MAKAGPAAGLYPLLLRRGGLLMPGLLTPVPGPGGLVVLGSPVYPHASLYPRAALLMLYSMGVVSSCTCNATACFSVRSSVITWKQR